MLPLGHPEDGLPQKPMLYLCGMAEAREQEIPKSEFKKLYLRYSTPDSGWTREYWNEFFEAEVGKKYFFRKPDTPGSTRMMIVSDKDVRRMIFLTDDAEESFFGFPET
jgi:hypothetical protein